MVTILNSFSIKRFLDYRQEYYRTFIIPALSAGIMGVVIFVIWKLLSFFTGYFIQTMLPIAAGIGIYFICILKFGAVREDELYDIPMGGRIVRIAKSFGFL